MKPTGRCNQGQEKYISPSQLIFPSCLYSFCLSCTSPLLTTILRIFKERYLLQDEDKIGLITHQFLEKNPENRFLKFATVKFSLVFKLFDEGKKTHVILHKGSKFWPQAIAEIGGNRQPIRNDLFLRPQSKSCNAVRQFDCCSCFLFGQNALKTNF